MKEIRFILATIGIFTGGVIGHVVGSGSLQVTNGHFTFLLLIALASVFLSRKSLEGPKLATVIALAQFGTHFFFSTSQNVEIRMAICHLLFGVLSYHLVSHLDEIFESILSAFRFVVLTVFDTPQILDGLRNQCIDSVNVLRLRFIAYNVIRRGPPVVN